MIRIRIAVAIVNICHFLVMEGKSPSEGVQSKVPFPHRGTPSSSVRNDLFLGAGGGVPRCRTEQVFYYSNICVDLCMESPYT